MRFRIELYKNILDIEMNGPDTNVVQKLFTRDWLSIIFMTKYSLAFHLLQSALKLIIYSGSNSFVKKFGNKKKTITNEIKGDAVNVFSQ